MQMIVVAELLVLVQAVLMVQRKNRRIYEQLAIFCLLELIVAAIFNDAFSYGLLLLPLGIVGIGGLALLQTFGTAHEAFNGENSDHDEDDDTRETLTWNKSDSHSGNHFIQVRSADSTRSFRLAGLKLPRATMLIFAPSAVLIAMLFFYGLPRTSLSASSGGGRVLVGFSDTVRLGQIGRMLQSDATALRVDLIDRKTGKAYPTIDSLYLRGAVLEKYDVGGVESSSWSVIDRHATWPTSELPVEVFERSEWTGDELKVRITVEPSNSDALFSIPPYKRHATIDEVRHVSDRWLLGRRATSGLVMARRMTYQFVTSAFRDGRQSRFVPRWDDMVYPDTADESFNEDDQDFGYEQFDRLEKAYRPIPGRTQPVRRITRYEADQYVRQCLEYDEYRVPSAWRLSEPIAKNSGPDRLQLANAIEQFLISRAGFTYSLNQDSRLIPGLDPIEQFLSVHKQGNCQYFASAMTLMLRSQGIPARLVVGYSTDEFNSIGGFYVARQLHAHAWVEALIDTKWIPEHERYFSATDDPESEQPRADSDGYWVRFDPTPGGGGVERPDGGRVADAFQLAQSFWSDFVVDRNSSATSRRDFAGGGSEAVISQYQSMFRWMDEKLSAIRAGRMGDGALAIGRGFSWPAAIFGVILAAMMAAILQFGMPRSWWRRRRKRGMTGEAALPEVPFFAETIQLLRRAGIHREPSQTPLELTDGASLSLANNQFPPIDSPLRTLTEAFYDTRFSGKAAQSPALAEASQEVAAALQAVRERVDMIESGTQKHPNKP
ncbi:MAG TPA: hypothetical protein DDZ51_09930 [Planctomycetaceae bacterium]|nr:hypothetical protein [Planctomycetaceae bacterium]